MLMLFRMGKLDALRARCYAAAIGWYPFVRLGLHLSRRPIDGPDTQITPIYGCWAPGRKMEMRPTI